MAQQDPKKAKKVKNARNGAKLKSKRWEYTSKTKVDSLYKKVIRKCLNLIPAPKRAQQGPKWEFYKKNVPA